MPVSSSSTDGESSSNFGAIWWIERRSADLIGPCSSIGRPSTSMMRPSVPLPTGTEIGCPVALHLHAAAQAVGGAHGDGTHHAVAQLLLDLEGQAFLDQRVGGIVLEDERVVDRGHVVAIELDVGDRADALDDGAFCLCHEICPDVGPATRRRRRPRSPKALW